MIELKLKRRKYRDKQTIGTMDVYKDSSYMFTLSTLERAWMNNKRNESCIKQGFYIVEHYHSEKHPNSFILLDTEPRTYILIHQGNYYFNSAGCILVGLGLTDINNDGYRDVIHSVEAMDMLRRVCRNEEYININID